MLVLYYAAVNTHVLSSDGSDALANSQQAHSPDVDVSVDKRAIPLSLNGDLRSLARMLFSQQRRRRVDQYAQIRQQMIDLGKRAGYLPVSDDVMRTKSDDEERSSRLETNERLRPILEKIRPVKFPETIQKRIQRLSINGALSSLAGMLAANGRQQLQEEMAVNRARLLKLGRRK